MEFIAVHYCGKETIINTRWIEEIAQDEDGSCVIYFAFQSPNCVEQDYIAPDESYKEVRSMIFGGNRDG